MQRVASGGELSVAARRRRRQTVACSWDLRWRSRVSVIGCLSIAREPSVGRGEKNHGPVESAYSPLGVRIAGGESVYAAAASIDEPGPRGVRVGPTRRLQLVRPLSVCRTLLFGRVQDESTRRPESLRLLDTCPTVLVPLVGRVAPTRRAARTRSSFRGVASGRR